MTTNASESRSYTHAGSRRSNTPTTEIAQFETDDISQALETGTAPAAPDSPVRSPRLEWNRNVPEEDAYGALYVHERMSGETFVKTLTKERPQQQMLNLLHNGLPEEAITEPYRHRGNWTNRLIRATAQRAMLSLLHKEGMAGEVDLVYLDPPYNISFRSQWQLTANNVELPSREEDALSTGPEVLRVFRDTYKNGVNGYLDGLVQQLRLARQLLKDSGSIIVQIGSDNLHQVAMLLAEVFGADNHICTIPYVTSRMQAKFLGEISNWLIWYGKEKQNSKFKQLYLREELDHYLEWSHSGVQELQSGRRRPLTANEKKKIDSIPKGWEIYRGLGFSSSHTSLTGRSDTYYHHPEGPCENAGWTEEERANAAQWTEHPDHTCSPQECDKPLPDNWHEHTCSEDCHTVTGNRRCPKGRKCGPNCHANAVPIPEGRQWSVSLAGLHSIALQGKLHFEASAMRWQMLQSEHPGRTLSSLWNDAGIVQNKSYFVETPPRVLERCILMTTDPGDLVLDLSCGSGAMPVMAENWGRRWISVDVSAVAVARERVTLSTYDNHILADSPAGHRADHENRQALLPPEQRRPFKAQPLYRNDPAQGFVNDRQLRVSARTLAYGPKPDGSDVIVHPDRTLLDKSKVRVAGPFTVESDSPHRAVTPQEYADNERKSNQGDLGFSNIQQHLHRRLTEVPIIGKKSEYRLTNIQPAPEHHQITHTAETVHKDSSRNSAILYIANEDETIGRGRAMSMASLLRENPELGKHVILVGFAAAPDTVAAQRLHPGLTIDTVVAHKDLQLANLGDNETDRPFTIISEPEVRLVKHRNGEVSVKMLGINAFDGNEVSVYGSDQWLSMMIDTDYDQLRFNCCMLNVNTRQSSPGKSRLVRLLRQAMKSNLDEARFEQIQTNESLPFRIGGNGAIAIKVIDYVGIEHMRVIANPDNTTLYKG